MHTTSTFASVLGIMLVADCFGAPVTILVDAATMAACKEDYGRHRLYGAIGWGTFSFVAGSCLHLFGMHSIFLLAAILCICTIVPSAAIDWSPLHDKCTGGDGKFHDTFDNIEKPNNGESTALLPGKHHAVHHTNSNSENNIHKPSPSLKSTQQNEGTQDGTKNFFSRLATLLSNPDAFIFFCTVTVMGCAVGTIEGFLFLYIEDLGGSETLMGFTLAITCVAETIVFYYTKAIIHYVGLDGCFHICYVAFLLRLGGYATLTWWSSPWLVLLPIELLHGITFGLTWSSGTAKSALLAPPGLEATTQSCFQGSMFGIGTGLGGLIAGNVYNAYGPQWMFTVMFLLVLGGWITTSLMGWYCLHYNRRIHQSPSIEMSEHQG